MWFRRVLLIGFIVALGAGFGWGWRRMRATFGAKELPAPVAEAVKAPAAVIEPSARLNSAEAQREGPEVPPPVLTGISQLGASMNFQWSDGTVLCDVDLNLLGVRWYVTRTALYVSGHRFPLMPHLVDQVPEKVETKKEDTKEVPVAVIADDDPVWTWSQAMGAWRVRDRSSVPGK